MIKGKKIDERAYFDKPTVNYRKIEALNQSMIKLFDSDPVKFYDQFKLGKPRREEKSTAIILGDLVDFFVLECDGDEQEFQRRFDEKFALFEGVKGTSQIFLLCDILFEITEKHIDGDGQVTMSFDSRFDEACKIVQAKEKYKGKTQDQILKDFEEKGQEYFKTKMDNIGKIVVEISLVDKAVFVGKKLMTDKFTAHLFTSSEDKESLCHLAITWKKKLSGDRYIECKAEIDKLEIDHENKIIQPYDLKTTYDNEAFDYMYIKNSYYLQNAFYAEAVDAWMTQNPKLEGYTLNPMAFVVADTSANNRRPLIYNTTLDDFVGGAKGFTLRGQFYRGINPLIEEIAWCEENNIWNCSKESFDKNGMMNLNIKYE